MAARILAFFLSLLSFSSPLSCEAKSNTKLQAPTPPRGWNSYDSFSWIVDEDAFLANAKFVADKLLIHGYEYVVVDYLWFRKNVDGAMETVGYDSIDEWGRVVPDLDRWPSSRGGNGFREVGRKVHEMGLKFGIHAMRGISAEAFNANTPILDVFMGSPYLEGGRQWRAGDIGLKDKTCGWMKGFMSVNTDLGAGKAFLRSLYQQYTEWGVDFVKLDCVFGDDLDAKQILTVSEILEEIDRPILFSLSPGTSVTPSMSNGIVEHVNMYRITGDDWDKWEDVAYHFNVARDFAAAKKIGAQGLRGRSWPDLDMLPLGWLTDPGVQRGPHRKCNLTLAEQRTQMTLWSMAKSPLMFGGDLRNIDQITYNLITNPTLLEINAYSTNNMEYPHAFASGKRKHNVFPQRYRSLDHVHTPDRKEVRLTSCSNEKSKGWVTTSEGVVDHICWKYGINISDNISHCLYKKRPLMTLDTHTREDRKDFQLLGADTMDMCLGASVNRKLSASERRSILLSACTWNGNQMWELNDDGTLVNRYSGLCAVVRPMEENVNTNGVRSWTATGRRGEIYLSFFNLNPDKKMISTRIKDLATTIDSRKLGSGSCKCHEVWTGKNFGIVTETLSMMVDAHGSRLFLLDCTK